ncbi:MAG: hypothetical protein HY803_10175 [candidate division NC10 bacterium]|nr:hypothetical protein [candidate division NC10 bacterium]
MAHQHVGRPSPDLGADPPGDGLCHQADVGEGEILRDDPAPAVGAKTNVGHAECAPQKRSGVRQFGSSAVQESPEQSNTRTAEQPNALKLARILRDASRPVKEKPALQFRIADCRLRIADF